jgi:hypothetical protein
VASGVAGSTNVDQSVTNFVAPTSDTYFVRVGGQGDVAYHLTVVTGGTFDAEPNDTFATAQQLVAGGSALGAISGSDDWYQITLVAGDTLTLTTATPGDAAALFSNPLDPAFELYDPNNTLIVGDDNSAADGRNATLTRTVTESGSYRVRVTSNDTTGEYVLKTSIASVPPPVTVQGIQVNNGTAQRAEVRSLTVTFSTAVTFANNDPTAAFALSRLGGGPVTLLADTPTLDGQGRTVVTLTFTGGEIDPFSVQNGGAASLADGRYRLSILDGTVAGAGGALDGDGNGTAGGTYQTPEDTAGGGPGQRRLFRLFGDADGNGNVDLLDLGQLRGTFNGSLGSTSYLDYLDADDNGTVDLLDLSQFRGRFNVSVF